MADTILAEYMKDDEFKLLMAKEDAAMDKSETTCCRPVSVDIDDVLELLRSMKLTDTDAWEVWEYNEMINEMIDRITDKFKKGDTK